MKIQHHINEKMRAWLIEWIQQVHLRFDLCEETLYITVNIIDRILEKCVLMKS
jgi:hypothetical protein